MIDPTMWVKGQVQINLRHVKSRVSMVRAYKRPSGGQDYLSACCWTSVLCCRSLLSLVAVARCCRSLLSLVAVARCCQSLVLLLSAFFPLTGKCTGKVCSLGELCINYLLIPCISLSNFSQLELFAGLLLLVRNTFAAN